MYVISSEDGSDMVTLFVANGPRFFVLLVSGSRILNGHSSAAAENEMSYGVALSIG